ncbi:MAG: periplasmic heavy metal sensor [Deltaproteobacteria bacterium]|jgi:Spy/CpxP family protein refolding chaperone|nr:periplasmic heavy metal sensor [Deltaproteobacteria bacterium]
MLFGAKMFVVGLAALLLSAPAMAQPEDSVPSDSQTIDSSQTGDPDDSSYRSGRGDRRLTEEQRASLRALQTEHRAKITPLLDRMKDLRLLYGALANNQAASLDEIRQVIADISDLRREIRAEFQNFDQKMTDAGFEAFDGNRFRHRNGFRHRGASPNACFDGDWDDDWAGYGHHGDNSRFRGHRRR